MAAIIAGPWYVRNWVRTGSPVYPFYINLWGGHAPGWDEQRSLLDQVLNARYGGYPKASPSASRTGCVLLCWPNQKIRGTSTGYWA